MGILDSACMFPPSGSTPEKSDNKTAEQIHVLNFVASIQKADELLSPYLGPKHPAMLELQYLMEIQVKKLEAKANDNRTSSR